MNKPKKNSVFSTMLEPEHAHRRWLSWAILMVPLLFVALAFNYAYQEHTRFIMQEQRTQLFRNLISTTDRGLIILDPKGRIVEWGPGAERLFGWKSIEVRGSTPEFLMPECFRSKHRNAILRERFDTAKLIVEVDCWAYKKDGGLVPVHIVAASFRNHAGFYHVALFRPSRPEEMPAKPEETGPPPPPVPGEVGESPYPYSVQP